MPVGYAPSWLPLLGSSQNVTDYSGYNPSGLQEMGYGNPTTGYSPEVRAAVDALNSSGMSTRDIYGPGGSVTHEEVATPQRNNSAGAYSFQPAFDDPSYWENGVIGGERKPMFSATNRDALGGGAFGVRNWLNEHPVGTIAAFIAAAAGGAGLSNALGSGAQAAGTVGQHALPASYGAGGGGSGLGAAAGGLQQSSGLGIFANGGTGGMAGVGAGNAGRLATSGLLGGGSAAGAGVPSWLARAPGLIDNAQDLGGLLGGGDESGAVSAPMGLGLGQPPTQQPTAAPLRQANLSTKTPYAAPVGRRAHKFLGQTIWM